MNQQSISNIATPAGRRAFQEYWHDLVVEQHRAVVPSLWQLWRTAAFGSEFRITFTDTLYKVGHPLGPRVGTRIFMEEIIARHYFNNVQALVYLGAVILLVFLGLRFANVLSESVSLIGIAIEALMLLILFTVLFYSPEDDPASAAEEEGDQGDAAEQQEVIREVLEELEQIGKSYAGMELRMERLAGSLEEGMRELGTRVAKIQGLHLLESHAERLDRTNELLQRLNESIDGMTSRIDMLFGKELEYYVRQEFERIVGRTPNNGEPKQPGEHPTSQGNA